MAAAALTAGIAANAAELGSQGVARTLFGLSQVIAESARNVRANKDLAAALARRVNELVDAIAGELSLEAQGSSAPNGAWLPYFDSFKQTLLDARDLLQAQARKGYLAQVLYQDRAREDLNALSERIAAAFGLLTMQIRMHLVDLSTHLQPGTRVLKELEAVSESLRRLPAPAPALVTNIPPRPTLYFGREAETQAVVDLLVRPTVTSGRVSILGGPGMGKTTLALGVLHHPSIAQQFAHRRFFVACDAAEGQSPGSLSCLTIVAGSFGIVGSNAQQKLLAELSKARTLLVLDNFESAWEAPAARADAEALLRLLADCETLSIVITLRGSERPQGVAWSRPFLPPLSPLAQAAARQVFLSISDMPDAEPTLDTLLGFVENVPLAVVLLANLAQYESSCALLVRWEEQRTAMLTRGDGRQRLNSLDVSIALSLHSPRMLEDPLASRLLSLLALLPQGVMDTDLSSWGRFPARTVSVLLRTALAYRSAAQRIHVLAPIRTFVLSTRAPAEEDARLVYDHYFGLAALLLQRPASSCPPEAIAAIAPELENVDSVIRFAFDHSADIAAAIQATESLCTLYANTGMGSGPDLLPRALSAARRADLKALVAQLLRQWGIISYNTAVPGDPRALFTEARDIYAAIGDADGALQASINLVAFMKPEEGVTEASRLRELAEASGSAVRAAKAGQQLGFAYLLSGRPKEAVAALSRAIATLRAAQETPDSTLGYMIFQLAEIYANIGSIAASKARLREALPIFQAAGFHDGVAGVHMLLGLTHLQQGAPARGVESLREAYTAIRASGTKDDTHCLFHLSRAHLARGDLAQAAAAVETARALIAGSAQPSLYRRTWLLCAQAELELHHGRGCDAAALLCAVRQWWSDPARCETHEVVLQIDAFVLQILGRAQQAAGDAAGARVSLVVSALLWRKFESGTDVVRTLAQLMEVVDDDAADALAGALMLPLHRFGYRPVLGNVLLHSAKVAVRRGRTAQSRRLAERALHYLDQVGDGRRFAEARAILDS